MCDPINPAPPVTNAFITVHPTCLSLELGPQLPGNRQFDEAFLDPNCQFKAEGLGLTIAANVANRLPVRGA